MKLQFQKKKELSLLLQVLLVCTEMLKTKGIDFVSCNFAETVYDI
jgi:hypothetical protein